MSYVLNPLIRARISPKDNGEYIHPMTLHPWERDIYMFSTKKFHTYDVNLSRISIRSALIGWHGNLSLSAKFLNDTKNKNKDQNFNVQGTESPAIYQEVIC